MTRARPQAKQKLKPKRIDYAAELSQFAGADPRLLMLAKRVIAENTANKQSLETLRRELNAAYALADNDPLCPVLNRRAFARELDREITRAERHARDLALLFIDLNNFKQLNDEEGHEAGDKTLIGVAATLLANVRKADVVARLGGDEFAVLLIETDGPSAQSCAVTLQDRLSEALTGRVSASIGIASWAPSMTANTLIAAADKAMFQRKTDRRKAKDVS